MVPISRSLGNAIIPQNIVQLGTQVGHTTRVLLLARKARR